MDNNDNNNSSMFVPYDEDPCGSPVLIDNFIEPDPALVYFDESHKPQQDHTGNKQCPVYSITDSTIIQDQYSVQHCSDNFSIELEELPNTGVTNGSASELKRKYPLDTEEIEDEYMNNINNNNYPNKGGLFNNLSESGPSNQMVPRDWSNMPRPLFCTSCQVLRHIIHTNGTDFEGLEIHGRIGFINHIIIQNQSITPDGAGPSCDTYTINFNEGSTAEVKSFLQEYCAKKDALGYIIVEDTFAAFYEAICTGYDWVVKRPNSEEDDLIPTNVEEEEPEPEPQGVRRPRQKSRKEQQSKRIQSMTLNDLSGVFHITMSKASSKNQLDMSVTAIKSICRRFKLFKWPQRQLQPLARRMKVLKRALESSQDPLVIQTTRMEVRRIKQEMTTLCGGVTPTGIEIPEIEE